LKIITPIILIEFDVCGWARGRHFDVLCVKIQNVKIQNVKIQNVKIQNVEIQNVEIQNVEIHAGKVPTVVVW
jgi:hypothetical protein